VRVYYTHGSTASVKQPEANTNLEISSLHWERRIFSMANFKDGVVRDGSSIGTGKAMGNIKDGIIRDGSSKGSGRALGNVKDGIIRDGSSKGSGKVQFNVKGDIVKNGSSLGAGRTIGKAIDFWIKGMERELEAEMVAAYHFLVKKII
jgi:hypothetical protein